MPAASMSQSSQMLARRQSGARPSRDRSQEFQRARRHSAIVRVLRLVLPLMALGVVGLYVAPSFLSVKIDGGRGKATVKAIAIEAGALKMIAPKVAGVNANQDAYEFTADSATQQARNSELMYLQKVRGKIQGHDGKVTTLTAPDAIHNNKNDDMAFDNGVVVRREPGMVAQFQKATANLKTQVVVSKAPVVVRLEESTIKADSMTLNWGEQRAVFEGNVRTHIERKPDAVTGTGGQEGAEASQGVESGLKIPSED